MIGKKSIEWIEDLHKKLQAIECSVAGRTLGLGEAFERFAQILNEAKQRKSSVWWVGNGGSAGMCSHLSQDILNKLGVRSFVLTDPALLTCMANDYGYSQVYARPLATVAKEQDVLIAISSSGKSENILAASNLAQQRNMTLVTLSGFAPNNPLRQVAAALSFYVPSQLYGQVEIGHETILHAVIEVMSLNK